MAVKIEWQDGTIDEGPTAQAVLEMIAASQWSPCTPSEMLAKLSDRAWIMSECAIDPHQDLESFFTTFADAGFVRILEWKPDSDGGTPRQIGVSPS